MQNKSFKFGILIGALLIAGLFFLRRPAAHHNVPGNAVGSEVADLKPSQLDFSKSNQIQEAKPVAPITEEKVQLQKSTTLSEVDQKKWTLFEEVLNSKNDNDPRVDKELRNLSPEMHQNLRGAYSKLPMENRNGRGFVAFLIARDLKDAQDVQFLKEIYQEAPCLSFQSCGQTAAPDPHFDDINETSLNYPQLVGLYQIEKQLEARPDLLSSPEMKTAFSNLLREARQFPSSAIQKRAQTIQEKYGL
jgi:hypothetical protein